MHPIVKSIAIGGLLVTAGCGTSSPYLTAAPPVVQTTADEPEPPPVRTGPRARRSTAARTSETPSSASAQDAKPLDYNSPEWKEREKRRDEELNRRIKGICNGC